MHTQISPRIVARRAGRDSLRALVRGDLDFPIGTDDFVRTETYADFWLSGDSCQSAAAAIGRDGAGMDVGCGGGVSCFLHVSFGRYHVLVEKQAPQGFRNSVIVLVQETWDSALELLPRISVCMDGVGDGLHFVIVETPDVAVVEHGAKH